MPNVTEAKRVPTTAARSNKTIVGAVDSFPHRPRILVWSVHSLNKAATSSVDCTLPSVPA
jgi:hypothetical protein